MPDAMSIGERIENSAASQGVNLKQLSKKAGVPYTTLYAIVNRRSNRVNPETLLKIAQALDTTPLQLQGLDYDPFPLLQHDVAEVFIERCKLLAESYPQEEIEFLFGDPEYLNKIIDGRKQPTEKDLADVSEEFNLAEDYLIGLTDDSNVPTGEFQAELAEAGILFSSSEISLVAFQIKNILQKNMQVACSSEDAKAIAISLWNYIRPENIIPLFKAINSARPEYQRAALAALQSGKGNEEADRLSSVRHKAWFLGLTIKPSKANGDPVLYDIWKQTDDLNYSSFAIETDLTLEQVENYIEKARLTFRTELDKKIETKNPPQDQEDSEAE